MRPLISAPIILLTLFLGGCLHVPVQPPAPPPTGGGDTTTSTTNTATSTAEIDTSDWLTYTNEEYGFGFRYPREWGQPVITQNGSVNENVETILEFELDINDPTQQLIGTEKFTLLVRIGVNLDIIDGFNKEKENLDINKSEDDLAKIFVAPFGGETQIDKIFVDNVPSLLIQHSYYSYGKNRKTYNYFIPNFDQQTWLNMSIILNDNNPTFKKFISTIFFE